MYRTSLLIGSALAAGLMSVSVAACAQDTRMFDIPPGSLRDALNLYATQADRQMLVSGDLVAGRRSPGLRGRMSTDAALERLLAGTGLEGAETRPGVVVVRRRGVSETLDGEGAVELDEVIVTGTLLRRAGDPASPVVTLDRETLDRRGLATVAEALTALPQNYAGSATPVVQLLSADRQGSNAVVATGVNLRGLGPASTLLLVNGRRVAGTGFRGEFGDVSALPSAAVERVDVLLDGASALYGPHNTILDNCWIFVAFSALDPLTQDKVSRLTGTVSEPRLSRSGPAGLGGGRASVSRSESDRPLLEPGEVRALPDSQQLVFVAGRRPLRTDKLRYDRRAPFRTRATIAAPDQRARLDRPPLAPHPWAGRRALGEDPAAVLPLFKEVVAAMDEKKVAQRAATILDRVAQEMAAQQAVLDQLQGVGHDPA